MTQIHQGYYEEETKRQRLVPVPQVVPLRGEGYGVSPTGEEGGYIKLPVRGFYYAAVFLLGALLGGVSMRYVWEMKPRREAQATIVESARTLEEPVTSGNTEKDIALINKILSGLVPMVEAMDKRLPKAKDSLEGSKNEAVIEEVDKAVVVTTEKASVREAADKDSKVLLALAKGTVVFATHKTLGWYRINLPIGGEGYVSESVVSLYVKKVGSEVPVQQGAVQ